MNLIQIQMQIKNIKEDSYITIILLIIIQQTLKMKFIIVKIKIITSNCLFYIEIQIKSLTQYIIYNNIKIIIPNIIIIQINNKKIIVKALIEEVKVIEEKGLLKIKIARADDICKNNK